jgi:hypothetical protein
MPNDSIFCGYDGAGCETKPIDFGHNQILGALTENRKSAITPYNQGLDHCQIFIRHTSSKDT